MSQNSYREHFESFLDHFTITQINVFHIFNLWFFFRQPFWQSSFFISVFLPAFQHVLKHGPSTVSENKKITSPPVKTMLQPIIFVSPLLCPLAYVWPAFAKNRQLFLQISGGALIAAIVNYNNHVSQWVHLLLLLLKIFLEKLSCNNMKNNKPINKTETSSTLQHKERLQQCQLSTC